MLVQGTEHLPLILHGGDVGILSLLHAGCVIPAGTVQNPRPAQVKHSTICPGNEHEDTKDLKPGSP